MLGLVALSGIFSGSETVLFSLSRVQLEQNAASANPFRRTAARLMRHPDRTLLVILLANTAVNVLLFASSYVLSRGVEQHFGAWVTPVAALLSVLLVMIGGEVVPKVLATSMADRLAPGAAAVVHAVGFVGRPIGRVLSASLIEPLTRVVFGGSAKQTAGDYDVTPAELKALLEVSSRRGVIFPREHDLLREIVDLQQVMVRSVMVPRVEVKAYDVNDPPDGLRRLIRQARLTKIPIYDGAIDNIVGLIYAKVLFLDRDKPLKDCVVPVQFVPEVMNCEQLLRHFRDTSTQLAIAVDEYGGMAGLITLEDILEEIVGDIRDPEDEVPEPEIVRVSSDEYLVSGRLSLRYWTQMFPVTEAKQRVATLGGLVTARLGRPASIGDTVRFGNVELTVIKLGRRYIEKLRLKLVDDAPPSGAGE